jgi:hypothetical protein
MTLYGTHYLFIYLMQFFLLFQIVECQVSDTL